MKNICPGMIIKHPFIYVNNTIAKSLFMFLIILLSFFYISTAQPYAYKKRRSIILIKISFRLNWTQRQTIICRLLNQTIPLTPAGITTSMVPW
jgi:hypothetical protein